MGSSSLWWLDRCQLHRFAGWPGPTMNYLGLVQPVDHLGQGVVATVAFAVYESVDASLGQPLAETNADVLRPLSE